MVRTVSGRAFTASKLDLYLPLIQELSQKHLERWTKLPAVSHMLEHVKFDTFELAQGIILDSDMPEDVRYEVMRKVKIALDGLACIFPVDLPGFPWRNVMRAWRRLTAKYQGIIDQSREQKLVGK